MTNVSEALSHKENYSKTPKCPICGLVNSNAWGLTLHMRRHEKERPIKCTECPKSFITKTELSIHMNRCHIKEKNIRCQFCTKKFISNSEKNVHEDKHGILKHKCKFCDETFICRKKRCKHHKTHIQTGFLTCAACNKQFATKQFLDNHYIEKHSNDFKCEMCQIVFNQPKDITDHQESTGHTGVIRKNGLYQNSQSRTRSSYYNDHKKYIDKNLALKCKELDIKFDCYVHQCKFCLKDFSLLIDLKVHINTIHSEDKAMSENYPCMICGKMFNTKPKLKFHMVSHGPKNYECVDCDYKSVRRCDLVYHIAKKHTKAQIYACKICSKTYTSQDNLDTHKVSHSELIFKCDLCSAVCQTKKYLISHKKHVHYASKMICDQCGDILANPRSLKSHTKKIHGQESDLCFCKKCGKAMITKNIKDHLLSCTKQDQIENSFNLNGPTCSECSIIFLTRSFMKQHYKNFHSHLIFYCWKPMCSSSFFSKKNLEMHLDKHESKNHSTKSIKSHRRILSKMENKVLKLNQLVEYKSSSYECPACGHLFLNNHLWNMHENFSTCSKFSNNSQQTEVYSLIKSNEKRSDEKVYVVDIFAKDFESVSISSQNNKTFVSKMKDRHSIESVKEINDIIKIEVDDLRDLYIEPVASDSLNNNNIDKLKIDKNVFTNHLLKMIEQDIINIDGLSFLQFDQLIVRLKQHSIIQNQ